MLSKYGSVSETTRPAVALRSGQAETAGEPDHLEIAGNIAAILDAQRHLNES